MTYPETNQDEPVLAYLASLKETPARNPEAAATGCRNFLAQSRALKARRQPSTTANSGAPPVSPAPEWRLKEWKDLIFQTKFKRRKTTMINALIAVVLSAALLLGGAGVTTYAAQDSLPNEPLYAVKEASEDFQLKLATQSQARLNLALQFTGERVKEMSEVVALGAQIQQQTAARYASQVQLALETAAGMNDEAIGPALLHIRDTLQQQNRQMEQLQNQDAGDALLTQTRQRLRDQLRLVEECLNDPQQLRDRLQDQTRDQIRLNQRDQDGRPTEPGGQPNGPGPNQSGAGPHQTEVTPQGGSGSGPQNPATTPQPTTQAGAGPQNPTQAPATQVQATQAQTNQNRNGSEESGGSPANSGGSQNQNSGSGGSSSSSSGGNQDSGGNGGGSGSQEPSGGGGSNSQNQSGGNSTSPKSGGSPNN